MYFSRSDGQPPTPAPEAKSGVVELRMATGLYTYFGWFPWSDFEGEALSEWALSELTGGQHDRVAAGRQLLSILNHDLSSN
ncbi:MAG: hypothetical protein ACHQ9S_13520 [Candidatus Binatia bacterium]